MTGVQTCALPICLKPVYWCFDCGSSLAEFEIEYADKKSNTLDVAFLCAEPAKLAAAFGLPALPAVPTMMELGVPVALDNMKGLMAPAGLPPHIQRYLHDSFRRAMQAQEWKDYVAKSGLTQDYADGPAFQKEIVDAYDLIGRAISR